MNIYLIRHGEAVNAEIADPACGLSIMGVFQARCLGSRLMQYQIDRIYSSDDLIALQTSELINKYLSVEIMHRHDLRDIDMGNFLRGWEFLNEFYPDFSEKFSKHAEDVPYPGGENGQDVMLRASNVISEILESGCRNVAVVTHMGTLRALICGIMGLSQARRFYIGTPIENCSVSIVKFEKKSGSFSLHTVNDYAHLDILNTRR